MDNAETASVRRYAFLALLLALLCAFAFQGSRGIYESTEGRYALCSLEMARDGHWMEPTIAGIHHWTKPPFGYWAIAGGVELLGANGWGARLSNAIALCLAALLVGLIGARMWNDRRTGVLAALIYATAFYPVATANTVNTDTLLCLFEILAVFCFWRGADAACPKAGRWWFLGMWAAFGLGFFTKGPPALLPLMAVIAWTCSRPKTGRRWGALFSPAGILLFFALSCWWFALIIRRHPDLLHYYLKDEVVNRVATNEFGRNPEWYAPLKLYFPLLIFGGGLWTFYFWRPLRAGGWRRRDAWSALWRGSGPKLFLLLWLALPLAVFCASKSRLPTYVLPLFAPVALAAARLARNADWTCAQPRRRVLVFALASAALLVVGKGVMGFVPEIHRVLDARGYRVAGVKLHFNLEGNLRRNMAAVYDICRPFDAPSGTRILLINEDDMPGFDFYCRAPVTRTSLTLGYVAPEKLTENRRMLGMDQVLQAAAARGERVIALCEKRSVDELATAAAKRGWGARQLDARLKWAVVELLPPVKP